MDFPDMFDLPLGTQLKIMAKSGKNQTFRIKKLIFMSRVRVSFPISEPAKQKIGFNVFLGKSENPGTLSSK